MAPQQLESGSWQVRWREPDTGKQRARAFKKKGDAVGFERGLFGDIARGEYVPATAGKITVRAWADEWLASARNLGAGGRETYRRDLDRHIIPTLGDVPLAKLTPERVDQLLTDKLEVGYAASTVHRIYRTVRRMCAVAVDRGRLARNPCDPVHPPRVDPGEMRFLTAAEVEKLHAEMGDRYKALILVACYGGPRWSEMVGLRRKDFDGARLTIAGQYIKRDDGEWHRDEPKTRAGRRSVTLPASVAAELAGHVERFALPGADGLVFPNRDGEPLSAQSWNSNVFKAACARAGLGAREKGVRKVVGAPRPHDLRHTAVALAIAVGAHPKAIQQRMGHASITITLDRYGHLFPEMDEQIAVDLDGLRP